MSNFEPSQTELSALGLTYELIMSGERIEIDPEAKINRKEKYVRHEFATKIIDAYADDLKTAYDRIEEVTEELEDVRDKLEIVSSEASQSTSQLKQILASDAKFAEAENLLATVEGQMESFVKIKKSDDAEIQNLKTQIQDYVEQIQDYMIQLRKLEELEETVPQMKDDVEAVLNNLRGYFADEGIILPEDDDEE